MDTRNPLDVVAGVVLRGGRLLIARRAAPKELAGLWEFPGGKLHNGESAGDALRREWREEFGMSVEPLRILGETVHANKSRIVRLIFVEGRTRDIPALLAAHDAAAWVYPSLLGRYKFAPADRRMVRHLLKCRKVCPMA